MSGTIARKTGSLHVHVFRLRPVSAINFSRDQSSDKLITALFNNMRTLKFKSQPTNAFFAAVNQMLGGSSQIPTTAESTIIKSNR